jgi:hypothetical protein
MTNVSLKRLGQSALRFVVDFVFIEAFFEVHRDILGTLVIVNGRPRLSGDQLPLGPIGKAAMSELLAGGSAIFVQTEATSGNGAAIGTGRMITRSWPSPAA